MYPHSISTIDDARRGFAEAKKRRGSVAPSRRAQEIFRRVEVNCEKQCEVAADLKISPARVSQHVGRVRAWLAAGSPGDAATMAHFDQRRLERSLAKERHTLILQMAIRELRRLQDKDKHITTKVEEGDKIKTTTTAKDQALSVQHMKIAQKAIAELEKLAELEPLPQPQPPMPTDHDLFRALRDVLCQWRQRAEHLGHVAESNWEKLVGAVIAALLGRNREPLPLDAPAREFIDNLLRGNAGHAAPDRSDSEVEAPSESGASANSSQTTSQPESCHAESCEAESCPAESCPVPPVPSDPHWRPYVTGCFSDLAEPIVRHSRQGSGVRGQGSGQTARQREGATEREPESPPAIPPSSAPPLQPPKEPSASSPGADSLQPSAATSNSISLSNRSASSAQSAVNLPATDEKNKIVTPYPPITIHFLSTIP
jgi:hypothetical protein